MTNRSPETILADALNVPVSEIAADTSIANQPAWDSLAHFRVVAAIEEALDRPLTPEEIFSATDYDGVKQVLAS